MKQARDEKEKNTLIPFYLHCRSFAFLSASVQYIPDGSHIHFNTMS